MSEIDLYQQLAEGLSLGASPLVAKMFKMLANENEAKLLLAASPPAPVEELAERTGLDKEEIEKMIDPLFKKGLLFKSIKNGVTRYYRVRNILQFHDSTAVATDVSREFLNLLDQFMKTEWVDFFNQFKTILPNPVMRVVPINVALEPEAQIMAFEDVKQLIDTARNMAVTACSCRVIDGSCGKPIEVCMQFDKAADYAIERGTGRKIDRKEAMDILRLSEEEGLVHISNNARSLGHVICNCCEDCCMTWAVDKNDIKKFAAPSRFLARVDADLCSSCETCLERCLFEAISMDGEDETARINEEKCMGCGLCLVTCPEEAVSLDSVRPEDFIPS